MTAPLFSNDELNFISDKTFFEKKAAVNKKVIDRLNELQQMLNVLLSENKKNLPGSVLTSAPKISRGENYKRFPWIVLDYPRVFNAEEVFAFRTLFWWGNSWVLTFQLSGFFYQKYFSSFMSNLNSFGDVPCKIGVGTDPWIHNPDDLMYVEIREFISEGNSAEEKLKSQAFFKLVKKVEFSQSEILTATAITFYGECLKLLKP